MVERQQPRAMTDGAEGVHVRLALAQPAVEFDAELEGRLRLAEKLRFVDAQPAIEQADLRDRRLTDTDRADRVGFDQRDAGRGQSRQRRSRHPSGGSAADDDNVLISIATHASPILVPRRPCLRSEEAEQGWGRAMQSAPPSP